MSLITFSVMTKNVLLTFVPSVNMDLIMFPSLIFSVNTGRLVGTSDWNVPPDSTWAAKFSAERFDTFCNVISLALSVRGSTTSEKLNSIRLSPKSNANETRVGRSSSGK